MPSVDRAQVTDASRAPLTTRRELYPDVQPPYTYPIQLVGRDVSENHDLWFSAPPRTQVRYPTVCRLFATFCPLFAHVLPTFSRVTQVLAAIFQPISPDMLH